MANIRLKSGQLHATSHVKNYGKQRLFHDDLEVFVWLGVLYLSVSQQLLSRWKVELSYVYLYSDIGGGAFFFFLTFLKSMVVLNALKWLLLVHLVI